VPKVAVPWSLTVPPVPAEVFAPRKGSAERVITVDAYDVKALGRFLLRATREYKFEDFKLPRTQLAATLHRLFIEVFDEILTAQIPVQAPPVARVASVAQAFQDLEALQTALFYSDGMIELLRNVVDERAPAPDLFGADAHDFFAVLKEVLEFSFEEKPRPRDGAVNTGSPFRVAHSIASTASRRHVVPRFRIPGRRGGARSPMCRRRP
jgi:hypothetical protein